jgi:hypothetical protein
MKKLRLRELPEWPPQPGGAYKPGEFFPTAGEAVVSEVFPLRERTVTFRGIFDGQSHSYHYKAENKKIALEIQEVVQKNVGKTVAQLAELEVEVGDK